MRQSGHRMRAMAALGVAALLGVSACSGSAENSGAEAGTRGGGSTNEFGGAVLETGEPARGGEFTFAMASPVEHLDPTKPIGASLVNPMRAVYDVLMTLDADGHAVPHLAESMESTDQKTWTMTLPAGVTFSDGTPFDAQAVVDQVNRVAESQSLQAIQAQQITSATAVDATTVEFVVDEPWADFPSLFADASSLAMIPSPTAFEAAGEQFGIEPVGAGPFVVEELVPGQSISMTRNPDYRLDDVPYLDAIEYVVLPESDARISGIQSGDVDAAALRTPADVTAAEGAGLTVLDQPGYNYYTIYMNLADPALQDDRVRQAISMAMDRDGINAVVFNGENEPMTGFFTTEHPAYTETDEWPAFDEAEAKRLVDEFKAESGQEDIQLAMTLPGIPEMGRIAAVVQQMLETVGITMEFQTVAPTTMVTDALGGNWQLQMRDSGIQPEALIRLNTNFNSASPANIVGEANPALDDLFAQARAAGDEAERSALLEQIQQELNSWLPQVPLVTSTSAVAVGRNVTHFPGSYPTTTSESFDPTLVAVSQQ